MITSKPFVPTRNAWDTRSVRRQDQFAYYREGLCQSFMAISPDRPSTGNIFAAIETVVFEDFVLSSLEFSPHTIRRTKSDVASMTEEFFQLSLYTSGGFHRDPDSNMPPRPEGSLYVDRANQVSEFCMAGSQKMTCLGLGVKRSFLERHLHQSLPDILQVSHSPDSESLFGSLSLLKRRFRSGSSEELGAISSAACFLLFGHLFRGPDAERHSILEQSLPKGLIDVAKQLVERELGNPHLCSSYIARKLKISTRYLQKIFADHGQTFHRYVREERLFRIRDEIASSHRGNASIYDIAARWGFRDSTTFHRAFKARFSDTPKQVRLHGLRRNLS